MLTDCVPLRDLLSLVLSRRRIVHRSFARLDELVAQAEALARRGNEVRMVVMVGPGLGDTGSSRASQATRRDAIDRLDAALAGVPGSVDLVVFDDAMDGEPSTWTRTRIRPRLRSPVPPRLFDVLRVIDDRTD